MCPTDGRCRDAGTQYLLTGKKRGSRSAPGQRFHLIGRFPLLLSSHPYLWPPNSESRRDATRGTSVFHRIRTLCA